jgi:hypothetical protein
MRKSFGQFETPEDQNPTGSQVKAPTPPIMGTPMPNAGIKNQSMGNVSPPKDKPSPQQFAKRQAAGKRMKQMPNKSPLGPITGGPAKSQARPQGMPQSRPQAGPQQQQQQQQQPVGTGDRWMGELWQGLTLDGQPQGGLMESQPTSRFSDGGKVGNPSINDLSSPEMQLYNTITMELESGGIGGYAHGGMVEKSKEVASEGRYGDSMLLHIQPSELEAIQNTLGPLTVNPETGNPEAALPALLIPLFAGLAKAGAAVGTGIAAAGKGLAAGATLAATKAGAGLSALGSGVGSLFAGGASTVAPTGVAAGTGPLAASTPAVASQIAAGKAAAAANLANLTGASSTLAPGAGVLAPGFGGGVSASQVPAGLTGQAAIDATMKAGQAGAGFQPSGLASLDKSKLLKALAQGGKSLQGQLGGQREGQAPPPPVPPSPAAPRPYEGGPSPEEMRRRRRRASGIGTLPGSGSII